MFTLAKRFLSVLLLAWLLPGLVSAGTLQLVKSADTALSPTGSTITFTINYTCPGITGDCNGVVITDILPPSLTFIDILADANTASATYATATRTATWVMDSPLAAGTTGQIKLLARFAAKVTPDGTVAANQATAVGTDVPPVASNVLDVTADATTNFALAKTRTSGTPVVDQDVTYRVRISSANVNGILNLADGVLTDTLPAGAVFVSASNGGVHSGEASGGTVTWALGTVTAGVTTDRYLVLRYPSSTFASGNSVTNNASLTGTPIGAAVPVSYTASLTHTLATVTTLGMGGDAKLASPTSATLGSSIQYRYEFTNNGSYPYDTLVTEDSIPPQLDVTSIRAGRQGASGPPFGGSIPLAIDFRTNLNPNWRAVTGSPFATSVLSSVAVSTLGLTTGEYITALRYTYSQVPPGFQMTDDSTATGFAATLLGTDRNGQAVIPGQTVVNTAGYTAARTGFTSLVRSRQATVTVIENASLPRPQVTKTVVSGAISNPGELVRYQVNLNNASSAGAGLVNPVIADFLDPGLEYGNTWLVQTRPSGMPDPIFEALPNYDGSGRTLLRWRWEGASAYTLPINTSLAVRFDARVKAGTAPGALGNRGQLLLPTTDTFTTSSCQALLADDNDLNGNGNRTESLCASNSVSMAVAEAPSLAAVKLVKGQLDSDFHAYPQSGLTVAGGSLEFRFTVTNTGNVTMTDGTITDILPFVGDTGVVDTSARLSAWRPELAAPVATPTGVVAYYSTSGNPCRPDMNPVQPSVPADFWPVGCEVPNWSVLPPVDITTVQSIRFDFGTVTLAPQQSFTFTFPLQAPISAPTGGEIAWNSYGYEGQVVGTGTKLLPSEPVKVGIAIEPPAPANYGNYVWLDDNQNGIQDEAASRGLNGVRVELYRYRGTGAQDPSQDTLVGFRLTGEDANGNPGYYQFTNQPAGSYYALFARPAGYSITAPTQGTDPAADSNADPATGLTPITELAVGETDFTWDMGVYPATTAEVGNYVWFDRNGDGIQNEATLDGLNGITVKLYLASDLGAPVQTTVTANDLNGNPGYYDFAGLIAGTSYVIEFVKPAGATFSTPYQGGNRALDSDAAVATGRTGAFTLGAGAYDPTFDAGIQLPTGTYSLGDRIFWDRDDDGLYEPADGDLGLSGVRVNLYRDDGDGVFEADQDTYWSATTTFVSDGPGFYAFGGLPAGDWIIQIPANEFDPSGQLHDYRSGTALVSDPSDNIDNDNNGYPLDVDDGVVTGALTLGAPSSYPVAFNPTLDIALHLAPPVMTLAPATATNQVCTTEHTVTATVFDHDGHEAVAGQDVTFTITAGPNTGDTGTDTTDANGEATFTWVGDGGVGQDEVVASFPFGTTKVVIARASKTWVYPAGGMRTLPRCRVDGDSDVDQEDYNLVLAARNQSASGLCDQRDADFNGLITINDAKLCLRQCTRVRCATQ